MSGSSSPAVPRARAPASPSARAVSSALREASPIASSASLIQNATADSLCAGVTTSTCAPLRSSLGRAARTSSAPITRGASTRSLMRAKYARKGCTVAPMSTTAATPTLQNFIDGAFVDADGAETHAVLTPAPGEELAQEPLSGGPDVDRAVGAARAAFETWSTTTPAERQAALLALADVLESHGDEIA